MPEKMKFGVESAVTLLPEIKVRGGGGGEESIDQLCDVGCWPRSVRIGAALGVQKYASIQWECVDGGAGCLAN